MSMRSVHLVTVTVLLACGRLAVAEPISHQAENSVPVAIVQLNRTAGFTEARLQTQAARPGVCWASTGPNSPYLLAAGHRYRFLGGDNIANCPARRDYGAGEIMVLRFEPLDPQAQEFSLVEGEGGENQMIDPKSSPGARYWNFLRVKAK